MKKKMFLYFAMILIPCLFSCNEEEITTATFTTQLDDKSIDNNIETLSKLLATAVADNIELRKVIKEEVGYMFDYDYDALMVTFLGKDISGKKFEEIMANSSNGKYKSKEIVKMICESGNIQLSIPVHFEKFEPSTYIPSVIPIYSTVVNNVTEELDAFKSDGTICKVSAKKAPDEPYFVIMRSERVDEDGLLCVNELGLVIPKENRIHYSDAVLSSRKNLKSTEKTSHIVQVISPEEYSRLTKSSKYTNPTKHSNKSATATNEYVYYGGRYYNVSVNQSDITFKAEATSSLGIELNWIYPANANKVELYRTGKNPNGGTPDEDKYVCTFTDGSTTKTFYNHVANEEYRYYAKFYNGSTLIQVSNKGIAHASHRRNNGEEKVEAIVCTEAMVTLLEGWWCSELELSFTIHYVGYDGKVNSSGRPGFDIPTTGKGRLRNVDWTGTKRLFNWDRDTYNFGAYTYTLVETDIIREKEWAIILDWIRFGLDETGYGEYREIVDLVEETILVYSEDDKIGTESIKWWDPNGMLREIHPKGFSIMINHF